jgi:t-SNARE complex subunit (syntaxin)
LLDLLNYQKRFIARSEKLWLAEDTDNIYDDVANASPEKLDEIIVGLFAELRQNFDKMSDMVADHVAMCRKVNDEVISQLNNSEEPVEEEEAAPKRKSDITR